MLIEDQGRGHQWPEPRRGVAVGAAPEVAREDVGEGRMEDGGIVEHQAPVVPDPTGAEHRKVDEGDQPQEEQQGCSGRRGGAVHGERAIGCRWDKPAPCGVPPPSV